MARWDSADLLAQLRAVLNRPATDAALGPDLGYLLLSDGQDHWVRNIAAHVPQAMWNTVPVVMATADGGLTYTIPGVTEIVGTVELRDRVRGWVVPRSEYIIDGATVRFPFGSTRTFFGGGAPYIRYIGAPPAITAAVQPVLMPPSARKLVVYHAAALYARRPGSGLDPNDFLNTETSLWMGDRETGDLGILYSLKDQYKIGDAELSESGGGLWYNSPDIGARTL